MRSELAVAARPTTIIAASSAPKVNDRFPVSCSAAKIDPVRPTKSPEPRASPTFREAPLRPCSPAGVRVITASPVLAVASPMPNPANSQPTPTIPNHSPGSSAATRQTAIPSVTDSVPYVISRSRRTRNQVWDCNQDAVVQPMAPTVSIAPATTSGT